LLCFRFNPDNPDVVVGGLSTGQVVFFDLSKSLASSDTDAGLASSSDSISSSLSSNNRSNFSSSGSGAATSKAPLSNVIKPTLVSFLDKSHASMISDIRWLPRKLELNKKGEATELPDQQAPFQFVTMANDGQIMFWDTRLNRFHLSPNEMPKAGEDPRWQPFYKYTVMRKDNIGVMNLVFLLTVPFLALVPC
jgi:WD40 repeat protein